MSWALVGTNAVFDEERNLVELAGNQWQCCGCGCEVYQPGDAMPGACPFCGEGGEDDDAGTV